MLAEGANPHHVLPGQKAASHFSQPNTPAPPRPSAPWTGKCADGKTHANLFFQKAKVRKRQRNFRRCHNQVSLLLFILFALYQDGSLQRQPSSPEIPTMYAYFPTGSGADVLGLRLEFKPSPLNRTFLEASQFSGREPS